MIAAMPIVQVVIDRQETQARLKIAPSLDARSVTLAACLEAARREQIRLSDEVRAAIVDAFSQFQDDPEPGVDAVISQRVPARAGESGWVQWQPEFDPDHPPSPLERIEENERADFYQATNRETVSQGQWVATIHEPTPGADGRSVRGEVIPGLLGAPAKLKWDETFELDADGRLIATCAGVIDRKSTRLRILRRLTVHSNADFSTGNIDFDGQVVIDKGVKDCFRVTCTGDLFVGQLVEAAVIDSGGETILRGGMSARGKGSLRVGGDLVAHYLSRVSGSITGNVRIEKEVYDCSLTIVRGLHIEYGALIGGEMRVGGNVLVGTIGSGGQVPTALVVGRQSELAPMMQRIDALIARLESSPLDGPVDGSVGADDKGKEVTNEAHSRPADRLEMLRVRRDEIAEFLESYAPPRIRVLKSVYPNATITIGQETVTFQKRQKGPLTIRIANGRAIVHFERTGRKISLADAAGVAVSSHAAA